MKIFISVSIAVLMTLTFVTCKKNTSDSQQGIVGKWQLVQSYDGYLNGGSFQWTNTTADNAKTIEFSATGQFKEVKNNAGNVQQCAGTYLLAADNKLNITSSCQTVVQTFNVSELTASTLIIDYQGREGVVREKYSISN